MRIAVLGIGSLVNHAYSEHYHKGLDVKKPDVNEADRDYPYNIQDDSCFVPAQNLHLPVRLGRLSGGETQDRRITNVICPGASDEQVFFAESKFTKLNAAIKNLREREGIPPAGRSAIGYVNLEAGTQRSRLNEVAKKVHDWAMENGYDAAIWTDLTPYGIEFSQDSNGTEILPLLQNDPVLLKNTKQYVKDLPGPLNPLQKYILEMEEEEQPDLLSEDVYHSSLVADFDERDQMKQTDVPEDRWFQRQYGKWGPASKKFPPVEVPEGVDPIQWKRDRIVEVAKHYTGLPYKRDDEKRGHFPDRGCGLDCSNFAAWVYNYGLGMKFSGAVEQLINGNGRNDDLVGRVISKESLINGSEKLQKGDLVFFNTHPKHVVIYIDENHIIDSTSGKPEGVQVRDVRLSKNKWCRPDPSNHLFIFARRPIE